MAFIGLFDVIGPNMVGPSSSHTAGAACLGRIAGKMAGGTVREVVFTLYGSFAETYRGHGTDRALLGGVLGFAPDDLRIRDSFRIAQERGLSFRFETAETEEDMHPNTADIRMTTEEGRVTDVRGVSLGGGKIRIIRINGVKVHLSGEYSALILRQEDRPGVVAHVARCLADEGVNIAYMRLYRKRKADTAYMIVESDEKIPPRVLDRVRENSAIEDIILVEV